MLRLVHETRDKNAAQSILSRKLRNSLKREGILNIGFPGGNFDREIYSAGKGRLWAAFSRPGGNGAIARHWNAFGVFDPERAAQTIAVEINIPTKINSKQVAGFFAQDDETGDIFLIHSGKVGGGRTGIGRSRYLRWSKAKVVPVMDENKKIRLGIAISKLSDPDLIGRIWTFVRNVNGFKLAIARDELNNFDLKKQEAELEKYKREFSGNKKGASGGPFEYVTYHGDIVQALYEERATRLRAGETLSNSNLIDLCVRKAGILCEIYEVKTGIGRQTLYTAIGQLITHASGNQKAKRVLVVPSNDEMPRDLRRAVSNLGITVRKFCLTRNKGKTIVQLQ